MYHYLKVCYDQWCDGQDGCQIAKRSEDFIHMMHRNVGYNKDEVRKFLLATKWFKTEKDLSSM